MLLALLAKPANVCKGGTIVQKSPEFPSLPLHASKPIDRRTLRRGKRCKPNVVEDSAVMDTPAVPALPCEEIRQLDMLEPEGLGVVVRPARPQQTLEKKEPAKVVEDTVGCGDCGSAMEWRTFRIEKGRKIGRYFCQDPSCPSKREK